MRRQHAATNISRLGGSRTGRPRFGIDAPVAAFAAWLFTSIPTVGFAHGSLLPPYSRRRPNSEFSLFEQPIFRQLPVEGVVVYDLNTP
jgi:hypothetical protein